MENQKNLILAVVFSIIVLLVFDLFYPKPKNNFENEESKIKSEKIISNDDTLEPKITNKTAVINNKYDIKEDRISFEMERIKGSINLYGATFDDVTLKDYRETIDENSKLIELLKKEGSDNPYLMRMGWASTDKIKLPNKNTLWKSDKKQYKSGETIILEWTNPENIKFLRKIIIDQNFIFKVIDSVENVSSDTIRVSNFAYIQRKNYRPKNKFFILHEGPLGVFNETLKEISYDELEEEGTISEKTKNGWIGITDHYWQVSIFPDVTQTFKARFKYINSEKNSIQVDYINDDVLEVKPNETININSYLFVGAKEVPLIDSYIKELNISKFDLSVDFGWFYFLTKPLFYALNYLSVFFGNFGVGIIILTIFVRHRQQLRNSCRVLTGWMTNGQT